MKSSLTKRVLSKLHALVPFFNHDVALKYIPFVYPKAPDPLGRRISSRCYPPGLTLEQVQDKFPEYSKIAPRTFRFPLTEKKLYWLVIERDRKFLVPRQH